MMRNHEVVRWVVLASIVFVATAVVILLLTRGEPQHPAPLPVADHQPQTPVQDRSLRLQAESIETANDPEVPLETQPGGDGTDSGTRNPLANGSLADSIEDADNAPQDGATPYDAPVADSESNTDSEQAKPRWLIDREAVHQYFKRDEWPLDNTVVCGFHFEKNHYRLLDEWTVEGDGAWPGLSGVNLRLTPEIGVGGLRLRGGSGLARWNPESQTYETGVIRAITMHNDTGEILNMRIFILPSADDAADVVLEPFAGMSAGYRGGNRISLGMSMAPGNIAIFRDAITGWQPENTNHVLFVRNNIVVSLECIAHDDRGRRVRSAMDIFGLAMALDREIVSQRAGFQVKPTLNVDLAELTVPAPEGWPVELDLTWSATHSGGGASTVFFSGRRGGVVLNFDTGERVVDPDVFQVGGGPGFDDRENPAKAIIWERHLRADCHVGLISWGPNLLPAVAHAALVIVNKGD